MTNTTTYTPATAGLAIACITLTTIPVTLAAIYATAHLLTLLEAEPGLLTDSIALAAAITVVILHFHALDRVLAFAETR